jgi:hypothetical protein
MMFSPEMPVISLWTPWVNWAALGWKPIETRTHEKFKSLVGKRIGIHAALRWDKEALFAASDYLTRKQYKQSENFMRVGGAIICTARVAEHRLLTREDEYGALIECKTKRYGLFLEDVQTIEAIPCAGKQGIWYLKAAA